ncbi:acyl carrier protein [Oceanibaculum nanhaiense]|uniref:acyl carrier protein n=1 Tax=Oceanibaculum nanhaiense TaxID=1909734 RepID=UPI000A3600BD|nr:acyl carrier protein [Oceanibaculum nanhaiense]
MDSDSILTIIVAQIRTVVPDLATHPIGRADAMADLGLDSIERSEIVLATLEELGLDIPMVQLHGPRNIGELADLLHAKHAG